MVMRTAKCEVSVAKRSPKDGAQRRATPAGAAVGGTRALTAVVGQPLVPPPLELLAVELGALLRPEVAGAVGAALRGGGDKGRGSWVHHWGLPPG